MANENIYQSEFTGQQLDSRLAAVASLQEALAAVEQAILAKYTKPAGGIPATDLDADVNAALAKANSAIQSLADYYTKSEVDAMVAAVNAQEYVDVTTLPAASADTLGKIYLVGPTSGEYDRYITTVNGSTYGWVQIGTTEISMANYATKAEVANAENLALVLAPYSNPVNDYLVADTWIKWAECTLVKRDGTTPASFSGSKSAATGVANPGINETLTGLTGDKCVIAAKLHVNSALAGAKLQINLYAVNYSQAQINESINIEAGKDYYLYYSKTSSATFSNPNLRLSLVPPSGYTYGTTIIADITVDFIGVWADLSVPSFDVARDIVTAKSSGDAVFVPVKKDVTELDTLIGEPSEILNETTGEKTLTTGDTFGLVASIDHLTIKTGDRLVLKLTGTAEASTIRVYQNTANDALWYPSMGGEEIVIAAKNITTILLYSNCTTGGTMKLDVEITTKGSGMAAGVSVMMRNFVRSVDKWCLIGDSLTHQGKYAKNVVPYFSVEDVVNLGVGGRCLADNGVEGQTFMCSDDFLATVPTDADLITILGGTNDWAQSIPIGEKTSTDVTTYCGALNHIIDYICTNIPAAHFVIITPPFGMFPDRGGWTDTTGVQNLNDDNLMDFALAAAAVAEYRGIPCAKVGQQVGWNAKNAATFLSYDGAYLHPNQDGGDRMASVLINYLNGILI